ncbi:hypothetical protein TUM20985_49280 [Mycobacterium antarcticum]|uniref:hypothetical protein n=1 Tax=unclassified Mycolicibacterium TaxID=2636767 RepID=UPI0023A10E7C|nr:MULTISPECIES: hypothetical protein [unclassified Mycolicibacterium]BDX34381.1 hypothetical protein TUM20985_49280 [Mycolicibacterium sp. TUM20985]GLP77588.1 hypothetical protein TUM20983_46980 [Mycolicibacterium sp. TUM20983]
MKSTLIVAGLIGFASAGGFALAAPASADCAPSFTSIPCTIATNVAQAPATTIDALGQAPGQFAGAVTDLPNQFAQGAQTPQQLVGQNCPADSPQDVCGLTGAPGQFFGAGGGLEQIVTAPQTIAGALAAAPGQFVSAIQNGGTAPETP